VVSSEKSDVLASGVKSERSVERRAEEDEKESVAKKFRLYILKDESDSRAQ